MPSIDFQKLKFHLLIIVGFAALSLLFCYPQLQGKMLFQSDYVNWQGMAHEGMAYHDSTGKDVLWSNSMFGGMPSYTVYTGAQSSNYPAYIQSVFKILGKPAYFLFVAMLCFYILMSVLKVDKWLGAIGAMAYAFSTYNLELIVGGHETKMWSMGYLPAILAGFLVLYRGRYLLGALLFSIPLSLMVANNHFQVIYYTLIMLIIAGVGMLIVAVKEGKIKQFFIASVIALVAGVAGAGTNMASILSTNEYTKVTMRGGQSELSGHDKGKTNGGLDKEYAFRWSSGVGETFCLIVPYLYGGSNSEPADQAPKTAELVGANAPTLPMYWGPQPFLGGPVYLGAVICFLFILGMIVIRSPHKWWMAAVCLLSIVMSWGKNFPGFNYFLFDTLPMLNKFRIPSMILVLPELLFPVIGIWGVQEILTRKAKDSTELWKDVRLAVGIAAGICVVLGVAGGMFFDYSGAGDARLPEQILKTLKEDRSSLATKSALMSALYILLAGGLLWAYLKDKIKLPMMLAGLGIVIAIDLIPVASHYLNSSNYVDASDYEATFQPRPVDQQILKDKDPYFRVLDLSKDVYNDATQAYFFKCVGGYHPAKMEIYQDLIDNHLNGKFNGQVLNMLNTKYIIVGGEKSAPGVIPNPEACGNAWFVDSVKWVNTADEEMASLKANILGDTTKIVGGFDPRKTAVIRNTFRDSLKEKMIGKDSASYVKLTQYGLDDMSFVSDNKKPGLAVFSDIYYQYGWEAYVDGRPTPILKANYVLRAIAIPEGQHKIDFHFRPKSFYSGARIAMISSVFLLLLCLGALYPLMKKGKQEEPKA